MDCGPCITPLSVSRISMGDNGVCVVAPGRKVWCSAANGLLAGINGDTQLLRGGAQTCRVASDGQISCWRANEVPTRIALSERALDVAIGQDFLCALFESGSVRCWGEDRQRQLGGSGQLPPSQPVALPGPAKAVIAGSEFACAVLTDGRVVCWGSNDTGVVNPAETCSFPCARPPSVVQGTGRVTQAVAGGGFVCVLADDGAVRCWGLTPSLTTSGYGVTDRDVATPVSGLGTTTKLGTGDGYACALGVDRRIRCWGQGAGTGAAQFSSCASGAIARCDFDVSTPVAGVADAVDLTTSDRAATTCVLSADGVVRCFGRPQDSGASATVCPWDSLGSRPDCDLDISTPVAGVTGLVP